MKKLSINSCSIEELSSLVHSLGESSYRASQIFGWLHAKGVSTFDAMKNLPKDFRDKLEEVSEITTITESSRVVSKKDGSMKILFSLSDGERVEAVLLRDGDRVTGCISTQVGCKMGCKFCTTAQIGFKRNMLTSEIVDQVRALERICLEEELTEGRLTNIVFMGMGEPLDNFANTYKALEILMDDRGYGYSHRRITVSTAGVTDKLFKLFELKTPVNLAISLNAPDQEKRSKIMPISSKYKLKELIDAVKALPLAKRKKITFEYVMLGGVNDGKEDAEKVVKLIKGMPVKINLIKYNGGGKAELKVSDEKKILAFQQILVDNKIQAFIRKSLGSDIWGACGQLAAGYNKKST